MKYLILILSLIYSATCFAKEQCDAKSVGLTNSSSEIEKYFYTGTCHYRNKDYQLSVQNWEKLALLTAQTSDDEELKTNVLNNLGYMKFFGFGTAKDQEIALTYWKEAILLGHYEAEYHLCHAYADNQQPTYQKAKAGKHCQKALLIYKGLDNPDSEILADIKFYLDKISQ